MGFEFQVLTLLPCLLQRGSSGGGCCVSDGGKGLGFRVWGLGFGVWGFGFGVLGLGFRV